MVRCESIDLSLDAPPGWEDRSVIVLMGQQKDGQAVTPNVAITRDVPKTNESLGQYADRQLVDMAKQLDGFKLIARRQSTIGGAASIEFIITWNGATAPLQQKVALVLSGRLRAYNIAATSSKDEYSRLEATFDSILRSIILK
jgi:hypothetical protein